MADEVNSTWIGSVHLVVAPRLILTNKKESVPKAVIMELWVTRRTVLYCWRIAAFVGGALAMYVASLRFW